MIENIYIKGFKCFDEIELYMKNLTILAGKNSIGKSTIIQAILAIIQRNRGNGSPFRGKYINIGKINELKNKYVGSKEISISINGTYSLSMKGENEVTETQKSLVDKLNIKYLSPDRVGVRETYSQNLKEMDEIGIRCEYAYDYLARHERDSWEENSFVYDQSSKLTFGGQVDYWLDKILGYHIQAKEIERTTLIRVSFGKGGIESDLSPINVGTGVSYIAEIIIAALSCKKGDVLIIENPEIHLHPSGQAEFVMFLAFLAQCGVQIILETHSDHIYNGARKCVHMDYIEKEDVAIYFFAEKENGCSEPVLIKLDDEGRVLNQQDGLFDQIKKDMDVLLGW